MIYFTFASVDQSVLQFGFAIDMRITFRAQTRDTHAAFGIQHDCPAHGRPRGDLTGMNEPMEMAVRKSAPILAGQEGSNRVSRRVKALSASSVKNEIGQRGSARK